MTNSISSTPVVDRCGFTVAVRNVMTERFLTSTRRGIKLFPNLTTLAAFLRKLGFSCFGVGTASYEPGRARPGRPDRAKTLNAPALNNDKLEASYFEGMR